MEWVQPKAMERHHELVSGTELFATVTWARAFGSLAEAATADERFTLKRGGFMNPYVTIRNSATDNDIAILRMGLLRHATLEFNNGRRITLVSKRFWGFEWEFIDESGQELFSIRIKMGMMRQSAEVTIHEAVRRGRDMMIMLLIGWYAMVLMNEEAAAMAASSVAVSASVS